MLKSIKISVSIKPDTYGCFLLLVISLEHANTMLIRILVSGCSDRIFLFTQILLLLFLY